MTGSLNVLFLMCDWNSAISAARHLAASERCIWRHGETLDHQLWRRRMTHEAAETVGQQLLPHAMKANAARQGRRSRCRRRERPGGGGWRFFAGLPRWAPMAAAGRPLDRQRVQRGGNHGLAEQVSGSSGRRRRYRPEWRGVFEWKSVFVKNDVCAHEHNFEMRKCAQPVALAPSSTPSMT